MKYICQSCGSFFDNPLGYDSDEFVGYEASLWSPCCNDEDFIELEGAPVQLKSGGPVMTISELQGDMAVCIYFAGDELKTIKLPIKSLMYQEQYCEDDNDYDSDDEDDEDYDYDDYDEDY